MQANPDKFQAIAVGKKTYAIIWVGLHTIKIKPFN
jgi:hypothetical protein